MACGASCAVELVEYIDRLDVLYEVARDRLEKGKWGGRAPKRFDPKAIARLFLEAPRECQEAVVWESTHCGLEHVWCPLVDEYFVLSARAGIPPRVSRRISLAWVRSVEVLSFVSMRRILCHVVCVCVCVCVCVLTVSVMLLGHLLSAIGPRGRHESRQGRRGARLSR